MTQKIQITSIVIGMLMFGILFVLGLNAPQNFPAGLTFEVKEGESLYSVSERLQESHIITSALLFRVWVSTLGKDKAIGLGVYEFPEKAPLSVIVAKMIKGPDEPLISVTIPEGYTTIEIAHAFAKVLPSFSEATFIKKVDDSALTGYLFPSTYYPLPSFTEDDVIHLMNQTFEKEYGKQFSSTAFPKYVTSRNDVISLAAILEGEAKSKEDMKIVSGILQARLAKGMRLQVDAASSTYAKTGIPKEPINNPGAIAIDAVFHPSLTPYLYYITGKDGKMYYAKTFEEHTKNIKNHLK